MGILRRQGDLLFREINEIPKTAVKTEGTIVAHGESGNLHQAKGGQIQLYKVDHNKYDLFAPKVVDQNQIDYIDVKQKTVVVHEEHNKIDLPKNKYAVVHEREYDPFAVEGQQIRTVLD
jgi:hypothetical protein